MFKLQTKSLFTKLALIIPAITILFWGFSSIIVAHYLRNNLESEFKNSNVRILNSLISQSINNFKLSDFYQLRRTLHDFYDESFMDYFAFYTVDMKPFATYPATQFSSSDIEFIENQVKNNSNISSVYKFFNAFDHRRFHFQQQVKDENGNILGYLFMGGRTKWLDQMVSKQIVYFIALGFLVLLIEIGVLIYFARRFTKPLEQLTSTLKTAQEKPTEDLIPIVLASPPLESTCSEVELFDSVVRKLLQSIQEYQRRELDLTVHATLGRLTAHFAHDIRTPLSTIGNYLDSAAPKEGSSEVDIEKFRNIKKQLKKIDMMSDELTSYTKARDVEIKPVNIKELLRNVQSELLEYPHLPKGLALNIDCSEELWAKVDKGRIDRVLGNIALNAIQAISHPSGKIDISAVKDENNLHISIKDNGCGIKPEHLPKVFDSSFTFGKPKGTGLGLAYCKNVIEAHKGTIDVESKEDFGTTFKISIPNCITKAPAYKHTNAPTHQRTNAPTQWLVIDDTDTFREQWRNVIKQFNLPPPIELKMPEDLRNADIDYESIGGAIVDYNYEGSALNGFDIVELLKSKGIPRIYLCTANYGETKVKREAERLQITGVIPKPIPEEFINPVTGILRPS